MKAIYKIDLAVIFLSVAVLIFVVGYVRPLVIAPIDDYKTSETEILFFIVKADKLLIDDNIDFTSPDEYVVSDGRKIDLKPGKYYWKAVGVMGGEVRTLTILSQVSLELWRTGEGSYGVVNSGNTRLNVDVYDGEELIEKRKLGVGEDLNLSGSRYVGGADE